jgi:ribonuclease P protein component
LNPDQSHEANLSAEQPQTRHDARIPRADAHDRRTERPEAPPRQGPPQDRRLRGPSKPRFETIFTEGRRASGTLARVIALPGQGFLGISTSKKIGNRPRRNRAKRRFREAVRLDANIADPRLDYVLIVYDAGADADFGSIQEEVRTLFAKINERWAGELESS